MSDNRLDVLLEGIKLCYEGHLVARIRELLRICEEEREPVLSLDSLAFFVYFVQQVGFVGYPDIVLTSKGYIRAKTSDGFKEFLPTGDIKLLYNKYQLLIPFVKYKETL